MPCKPFENCAEFINEKRAISAFTDIKSKTRYIYNNRSGDALTKYRVDGCLIVEGSKCDYLLLNCNKNQSFFIELKGSDLIKAVEQIESTIDSLKNSLPEFTVHARIVLTRVNTIDLKNSKYLRLEQKVKKLNGDLRKQSRELTEMN